MPKRRLTDSDYERMAVLRERGVSYNAIGKELGCSGKAVSWHCLRLAIDAPKPAPLRPNYHLEQPLMKRGNHIVRAFTPDEDKRLIELEAQGLGNSAIGRVLGRRPNSIAGRLMTLARRDERAAA